MSSTNLQLLKDDILILPCISDIKYYPDYIKRRIDRYYNHVTKFEGKIGEQIRADISKIHILCDAITDSLNLYYQGFPSKAFFEFKRGLDSISNNLFKQKRNVSIATKYQNYYRARIAKGKVLDKSEMFHIPFDKRGLIKTQRYSIPGLPCLYLSDSIYACWAELDKPPIEDLQFVRMELDYKFLDLSVGNSSLEYFYEPAAVKKEMDEDTYDDWILNFLFTWPLSLACYVSVSEKNADFKPEYIIPQMLLEWIRMSEDLDGVKYYSAKSFVGKQRFTVGWFNNFAIPVKRFEKEGLCPKLKYDIKVSETLTWNMLVSSDKNLGSKRFQNEELKERWFYNPTIYFLFEREDDREPYANSDLGKIEYGLQKQRIKNIE